jgi:DNA-binding transcriptional regulator YhcF (GntR family)
VTSGHSNRIAALGGDLNRKSVAEQVVGVLREEILRGNLEPGTPLPEVALAQSFGVSRNTVREAIRSLVNEGLARHHMHRGAVVTEQTVEDIADIHQARSVVELAAIEGLTRDPKPSVEDMPTTPTSRSTAPWWSSVAAGGSGASTKGCSASCGSASPP